MAEIFVEYLVPVRIAVEVGSLDITNVVTSPTASPWLDGDPQPTGRLFKYNAKWIEVTAPEPPPAFKSIEEADAWLDAQTAAPEGGDVITTEERDRALKSASAIADWIERIAQ